MLRNAPNQPGNPWTEIHRQNSYFRYSKTSPGWQSSTAQIASSMDIRTARALPFLIIEMLAIVVPSLSEGSATLVILMANMTSKLLMRTVLVCLHFQDILRL